MAKKDPEKKTCRVTIRFTPTQYSDLVATADQYEDRDVAWLARKYILDALEHDPKRPLPKDPEPKGQRKR